MTPTLNPNVTEDPELLAARRAQQWQPPEIAPALPKGAQRSYIVAVRRKRSGKVYTFPAQYLQALPLVYEDCICGAGAAADHPDDGCPTTGWFDDGTDGEYDHSYSPLLSKGDELVAWREIELHPLDARAALSNPGPVALGAGWNTDLDAMPHALTLLFKAHDPDEPEGVVSLGIRGEEPQRLIAWSFLPSAIHPAPSREAVIDRAAVIEECARVVDGFVKRSRVFETEDEGGIKWTNGGQVMPVNPEEIAAALRSLPSNAPSLGEARLAEGEAVAWRYLERGEWKYVGGLIKPQPGNSYPVEPLYSHPSHVQAEAGEAMKPTFGTPSGYVEVPPADLKGDEELARHWIDRYACGIDAEPQMNRIRAALNKGL